MCRTPATRRSNRTILAEIPAAAPNRAATGARTGRTVAASSRSRAAPDRIEAMAGPGPGRAPAPGSGAGAPPPPGLAGTAARRTPPAPSGQPAARPAPGPRPCWARPTSRARCRCGRSPWATSTTRRSRSSGSTPGPRSGRRCWSPRSAMLLPVAGHRRPARRARLDRPRLGEPPGPRPRRRRPARASGALLVARAALLQALGLILVTGMIAHVTAAAAVGRRLSLGEAWAATRGKRAGACSVSPCSWACS